MKTDAFTNTIIVADTTKVLPELITAGKQYQVIIADPPYNCLNWSLPKLIDIRCVT
jgi:hypothetical protein